MALAVGAPLATLEAVVEPNGRISGVLRVPPGFDVVDALTQLPEPSAMLHRIRTFPGAPDQGEVRSEEVSPGVHHFVTRLPRRFGGIGHTRHGTYAHGGFYPQPVHDGVPVEMQWQVTVRLPSLGTVNDSVGTGLVQWSGLSDRVSLAVPRQARAWTQRQGQHRVTVVGKRRPRRSLWRHLSKTLPSLGPVRVVLAEAPLRRRLFRTGVGSALVSDRIFRLAFPFETFHRPALVEGLRAAHSRQPDPQLRELVGWTRAQGWMGRQNVGGASGFTKFFSWVPSVDALLSSRRIAFYREIFRDIGRGDPVADDLYEMLHAQRTGAGLSVQIEDTHGTADKVVSGLELGLTAPQSFQLGGVSMEEARAWRQEVPRQNYVLDVGEVTTVTREAPPHAPMETVIVKVDGKRMALSLAGGESWSLPRPGRIVVDPGRHTSQFSRSRDAWPVGKLRVTGSTWVDIVNLTRFRLVAGLQGTLRGRYDNRNRFIGSISTDRSSIARVSLGYRYKFGPLLYGITRRHRLAVSVGGALLDPSFQSLDDGRFSLSGSLSWSWANYGGSEFPVRGLAFSASSSGRVFPNGVTRSGAVAASARGILSPHPRHAFAGRLRGAYAGATRDDLLLTLGGPSRMRSLPVLPPCGSGESECADVATAYAFAAGEYRVAALRGLSVPAAGLFWGTELQLTVGMEGVAAAMLDGPGLGVGATVGGAAVYDNWGAEPMLIGVTMGWPLWDQNLDLSTPFSTPVPEIYLRFSQAL